MCIQTSNLHVYASVTHHQAGAAAECRVWLLMHPTTAHWILYVLCCVYDSRLVLQLNAGVRHTSHCNSQRFTRQAVDRIVAVYSAFASLLVFPLVRLFFSPYQTRGKGCYVFRNDRDYSHDTAQLPKRLNVGLRASHEGICSMQLLKRARLNIVQQFAVESVFLRNVFPTKHSTLQMCVLRSPELLGHSGTNTYVSLQHVMQYREYCFIVCRKFSCMHFAAFRLERKGSCNNGE